MSLSDDRRPPTSAEVAAAMAAIEVLLGEEPPPEPVTPVWRWAGRRWRAGEPPRR
jgi:hypothetical protein